MLQEGGYGDEGDMGMKRITAFGRKSLISISPLSPHLPSYGLGNGIALGENE